MDLQASIEANTLKKPTFYLIPSGIKTDTFPLKIK